MVRRSLRQCLIPVVHHSHAVRIGLEGHLLVEKSDLGVGRRGVVNGMFWLLCLRRGLLLNHWLRAVLHLKLRSKIILSRVLFDYVVGDLLGVGLLLGLNACIGASFINDAAHDGHCYFIAV